MPDPRLNSAVWKRLALVIPVYLVLYTLTYFLATFLRFDFAIPTTYWDWCVDNLPAVLLVKTAVLIVSREWQRRHRYSTMTDAIYTAIAASVSAGILFITNLQIIGITNIPRAVLLVDVALSILAVSALRSGLRMWLGHRPAVLFGQPQKPTLIVGNCSEAFSILRSLESSNPTFRVVGVYDESAMSRTMIVGGVRVFGPPRSIHSVAGRLGVEDILAPSTHSGKSIRELVAQCQSSNLKLHVIPSVNEIVDGRYKLGIRDVAISDLLRRAPNQLDMDGIRGYVTGRRVLVTGAAGSIGSELSRQIAALGPLELTLLDQSESGIFAVEQEFKDLDFGSTQISYVIGDITNHESISNLLEEKRPELIFHAAAYKHVPLMEHNPREAVRNNILGTKNLVDLASEFGVSRFVLISTDKAVRPTSLMGATKLMAEKYLQAMAAKSDTKFITVRFGNVLNSAGSVVPTFRKQIEQGGPITVTHPEMVRFFMTIPEAVQLVLQAGAIGETGDVLILDMGEPVKIVDLAKDLIMLSGLKYPEDIDIVFTGMRPGEKLYEELFYETETGAERIHEKIFRGTSQPVPYSLVASQMAKLKLSLNSPARSVHRLVMETAQSYVEKDRLETAERATKAA